MTEEEKQELQEIVEFLKNYIDKIAKQFSGSRLSIEFADKSNGPYRTFFAPIDISIIVDNMVSNAKKAYANSLKITVSTQNDAFLLSFVSNRPFGESITKLDDVFERGFSTTKSTGVGLYHVKNIVDENLWSIEAKRSEFEAEFLITIRHEDKL